MLPEKSIQTIFVSIASYRDPDCQNTVRDLFEKATYPNRVFIGVCLQVVPGEDDNCLVSVPERFEQLRIDEVPVWESLGACWARSRIQALWRGEDYFLQVDSHMRFVRGWDEKLIAMLAKCPSGKPVLSTYPLSFTPPDTFADDSIVYLCPRGFDEQGVLRNDSTSTPLDKAPDIPSPSFLIGAGLVFTLGRVVEEVPYDPQIYFQGEEITLAVRLWTSGWDIFTPNQVIAYHDYGVRPKGILPDRVRHWEDKKDWYALDQISKGRICHLLGIKPATSPDELREIGRFGLGSVRSISEYEAASGLDFKARLYKGLPYPHEDFLADKPDQIAQRRAVFSSIWTNNSWGDAETRSGPGSTMSGTVELRTQLSEILRSLDIRILADAGCGDLNWMKELTGHLRFYFGYDIVAELVAELRARYRDRVNCFFTDADIVMADLPECDAILCRDCLTHLPLDAAFMALKRFRQSGARFLLATTHSVGRNIWVSSGGWYAIDMTAPPFNFPAPQCMMRDGGEKMLGVWDISGLPEQYEINMFSRVEASVRAGI